ncbi:MAG: hypothetical protein ACI80N_003608 [Gammaproteobacteria bacterium]|jgi:hypothetical protein
MKHLPLLAFLVIVTIVIARAVRQIGAENPDAILSPALPSSQAPATDPILQSSLGDTRLERAALPVEHALPDATTFLAQTDPAFTPVALPSGALHDQQGAVVLKFTLNEEHALGRLNPGTYTVTMSGPGWTPSPTEFTLDALDLGSLGQRLETLLSPAAIYRGRVVDERTSGPVEVLNVTARYREAGATWETFAELRNDTSYPNGVFQFGGVPIETGEVSFAFKADGYFGGQTDWLPVGPGVLIDNLAVVLRPDDQPSGDLVGRVIGQGRAIAGTDVSVFRVTEGGVSRVFVNDAGASPSSSFQDDRDLERTVVKTGSDGEFSVELRPGEYRLMVSHDGYAPQLSEPITVLPGVQVSHDLILKAGTHLIGRLQVSTDDPHLALSSLRVWIEGQDVDYGPMLDDEGEFQSKWLAEGHYLATVRGGAGRNDLVRSMSFQVSGEAEMRILIPCGSLAEGVTIDGRIDRPAGTEGLLWIAAAIPTANQTPSAFHSTTPDNDGRFRFHGLPEGEFQIGVVGFDGPAGSTDFNGSSRRFISVGSVETTKANAGRCQIRMAFEPTVLIIQCEGSGHGTATLAIEADGEHPQFGFLAAEMNRVYGLHTGEQARIEGLPPGHYRLTGSNVNQLFEAKAETVLTVQIP